MMKLATRERKEKKRDFGSAPFLPASSYCFPLRILLLLLARAQQRRERGISTSNKEKRKSAERRAKRRDILYIYIYIDGCQICFKFKLI
jgi:hypothetical protein